MNESAEMLSRVFGDYRDEWRSESASNVFVAPPYFTELMQLRPSFLIGGRGTGKTTALRRLSYDHQEANHPLDFLSIYVRINKNRVRAFIGNWASNDELSRLYAHYFNLLSLSECLSLWQWACKIDVSTRNAQTVAMVRNVASQLGLSAQTLPELEEQIGLATSQLELFVNNRGRLDWPVLSIAESALRCFAGHLYSLTSKPLIICIDEYENLTDLQQAVLNTYIKHADAVLSYKVGTRLNGLRCRNTLGDTSELLTSPEDFAEIDISNFEFDPFAKAVAQKRLDLARSQGAIVSSSIAHVFEELTPSDEAERLGASQIVDTTRKELEQVQDRQLLAWFDKLTVQEQYFIRYWHDQVAGKESAVDIARSWMKTPQKWSTRIGNYGYASLFWLSKGRKGVRVRKFYCGLETLIGLASGNIRYFLELCDESFQRCSVDSTDSATEQSVVVSAKQQTEAARVVGERRLRQIESTSENGVKIKRLVLAIGHVFSQMARDPIGSTPEVTQFVVRGNESDVESIHRLLDDGVSHLAFECMLSTKATSKEEMQEPEYRLHPIYAPFFFFSHRRKRKTTFQATDLLNLGIDPKGALRGMLRREPKADLDERQLSFYGSLFSSEELP